MSASVKLIASVIVWAGLVGLGVHLLWNYESRAGARLPGAERWPAQTSISPVPDRYNLVMAVHPQCPCTAASVDELYKIVARANGHLHVHALLNAPAGADATWTHSSLARALEQLPETSVIIDTGGRQAQLFGATTSGDTQLFAPDGRRVFHGGITASRGHAGDNDGSDAILAFLNGAGSTVHETPVYGCSISGPALHQAREEQR